MKPIIVTALLVVALMSVLAYKGFTQVLKIADKFSPDKITLTFRSSLKEATSTKGDILELATLESDEFFRNSNERRFNGIYLGTTVAEIQARSTFRYHLRLSDKWTLNVRSNICLVRAPLFLPTLPVAIQTDKMDRHAESGWARFDKHDQLRYLENSMTPELARRARDSQHMEAVREKCRHSVGEFVKNWLLREDHWRKDGFSAIIVQFPDEVGRNPESWTPDAAPVLRLGD